MIYFDNNATTPVAPEALEVMLPYFTQHFGNPASRQHAFGWVAEEAVDQARKHVAEVLKVEPLEICFTSGATEACNLALKGVYGLYQRKGKHIITVTTEHKAVLDTCHYLESLGAEITYLPVDTKGFIDFNMLRDAIRADTILVAVMWANNETGVIHPIDEIGKICAEKGTMLFSDATQAVGKIPVHPRESGVQLLALSAHKFYGPKGIGVLYISRRSPRVKLSPLIHGGGHEEGMRSGTLNVPNIVGLGRAITLAQEKMMETNTRLQSMRDRLESSLLEFPSVFVNGDTVNRLSHVSNIRFDSIDGGALMTSLSKELAIASGSACTSANPEPSHVLQAMGLSRNQAKASLRISLGRFNTEEEVHTAIALIKGGAEKLREQSVEWGMRL
ncbi:MAG TPA: cysteine desulfurase family protein [Saprospiraceae bacterium]|nr:cysteine desulfurase family protein [Saprospiraceae bacterium]